MKRILPLLFLPLVATAAWTVTTTGAPSGCTHVISDGNWQIGVYRYSDDNWNLGQRSGNNGSSYVAGSGDLDLTGVAADCGVVLKRSRPRRAWRGPVPSASGRRRPAATGIGSSRSFRPRR